MSTSVLVWVAIFGGVGTFLIRFLPMLLHDRTAQSGLWAKGPLRNGLNAVGPAAILALLVSVTWSMVSPSSFVRDAIPIVAGFAGVIIGKYFLHGIAWATLSGVTAYGVALWSLTL